MRLALFSGALLILAACDQSGTQINCWRTGTNPETAPPEAVFLLNFPAKEIQFVSLYQPLTTALTTTDAAYSALFPSTNARYATSVMINRFTRSIDVEIGPEEKGKVASITGWSGVCKRVPTDRL